MSAAETYDAPLEATTAPPRPALHRLDAEQALLGALLLSNELVERLGALRAEHFFDPVHQRLFAKLKAETAAGNAADLVTLRTWAMADAGLAELGGPKYLMQLSLDAAPLTSQVLAYADLVRDVAQRRAIAAIAEEIAAAAHEEDAAGGDAAALIVEAERRLAELADEHAPFGLWREIGDVAARALDAAREGRAAGISTGLARLDEITGGLCPGQLWVIAGPPSGGKSLVGAAIAGNVAEQGHGVGYVHLEMGEVSVGLRALTARAHDPALRDDPRFTGGNPTYLGARRQKLSDAQWRQLEDAQAALAGLPLRIDARPHQTLSQIESGARRLKRLMARAGTPLAALFIDHEGLIAAEKDRKAKWEEVSDRIVRLQGLAKKLDVTVVALVQINREGARQSDDQRPHMGHLANSADIERCADVICLLYREAYFAQRKPKGAMTDEEYFRLEDQRASPKLEIIVDKSRDGARETVKALLDVRTGYLTEDAAP